MNVAENNKIIHLSELEQDRANANKGSERGQQLLETSFRQYGAGRSILIDKKGRIIAGNKSAEQAMNIGMEDVVVVQSDGTKLIAVQRTDLDLYEDEAARKLAYMDNRSSEFLAWDAEQLLADMQSGLNLSEIFKQDELDALLAGLVEPEPVQDVEPDISKADELQKKWSTSLGQIWQMGKHKLACGDCTDIATVERLMQGEKAVCMWTDPPYGVSYVGKTKNALTIENDGSEGLHRLLEGAFECADMILAEGGPFYIAAPPGPQFHEFSTAIIGVGWKWHETLAWVKDSMVLGHSDYHYKHEAIFYGWKGKNRFWYAGRDQVSVLEFARPKRSEEHPTMKPVELITACLENSTKRDDIVYEPFGGSGTTGVACEQLGRQARMIEISPAYCAVILERFDGMGIAPVLLTDATGAMPVLSGE